MLPSPEMFDRSIRRQIELNQRRTQTERFQAMCALLDALRAMAPKDASARGRRRRALEARQREREAIREQWRRHAAAQRADDSAGL